MTKKLFMFFVIAMATATLTWSTSSCKDANKARPGNVELNEDGDDDEYADDDDENDAGKVSADDHDGSSADEQESQSSQLTFENMAGVYESLSENGNSESRLCLFADGTATWVMIGSLTISEYTYTIHGNTICLELVGYEGEDDCYDYIEDERALKNEQGTVYYRQIEE